MVCVYFSRPVRWLIRDARYQSAANPTEFVLRNLNSGKQSKSAVARFQRAARRVGTSVNPGSRQAWSFWCPSHIANLAFGDALQAMYPVDTHPLFSAAKMLAGKIKRCPESISMLKGTGRSMYAEGAFDDQGGYKVWQLLKFGGYIKVRWESLHKMLKPMYRAGPVLFKLQSLHESDLGMRLPTPLAKLLFSPNEVASHSKQSLVGRADSDDFTDDDDDARDARLWTPELFAHICNLLDVFDPVNDAHADPDPDSDDSHEAEGLGAGQNNDQGARLIGFGEFTKRFQARHGVPIVHASAHLDGLTQQLEQMFRYAAQGEAVIHVAGENAEEADMSQMIDELDFDVNYSEPPTGSRVTAWLATNPFDGEGDGGDVWAQLWPELTEFGVRLRRAVLHRFKYVRGFYDMCALLDPRNHTEDTLADTDPRVQEASRFATHALVQERNGGKVLQELRYRSGVWTARTLPHGNLAPCAVASGQHQH